MERGRPRIFDKEQALDAALAVFWRSGYQAASLAELTQAMGITKPSLYAAFGNKEQLYLQALERYQQQQLLKHAARLTEEPDLTQALRTFLRSVASMLTAPDLPGGCMVVTSAVACDTAALPRRVQTALAETVNLASVTLLQERLTTALHNHRLPVGTPIEQLADYFVTIMSGMAVMAKVGTNKQRLFDCIEHALRVLPQSENQVNS